MNQIVLGIDIAKDTFAVYLVRPDRSVPGSFANDAKGFGLLARWLTKHHADCVHACMEATGRYWEELAFYLYQAGHKVSVVNPARIHSYAQSQLSRNKTDALDAELIARFCQREEPPLWTPPPQEVRELQAMTRHLDALLANRTQETNRLHSGTPSAQVRKLIEEHLAFLDAQIEALQERIQAHIDDHPSLKASRDLLSSIDGIGETTAARLLGDNIHSFSDTKALAAYAGLSPMLGQSGSSVHRQPRISRTGSASLRKALYWPAITAMRCNPVIARLCQRLRERGKPKKVIIAAAMRKLLCLALGVLKSGVPFRADYVPALTLA